MGNYFVIALLLFVCLYLISTVSKLNNRLKGLEYRLEQMSIQSDVPENLINNDLRQLIKDGKDVVAVKRVRETLGLSLLEGKQYIDALKLEVK